MFFDDFSCLIQDLSSSQGTCLITGDFNLHMETSNQDAEICKDLLDSAALQQHVNSVTHKKGHTLDLIISGSEDNLVSNVRTSVELPSDHAVITCQLDIPRPKALKISMTHCKIKQIDHLKFGNDISSLPLICSPASDLSSLVNQYHNYLSNLLNVHATVLTRSITSRPHSPWYTDQLRDQVHCHR